MKTAVLISGPPRTYKECFPYFEGTIMKKFNPDIFIHTWSLNEISIRDSGAQYEPHNIDVLDIINKYQPEEIVIEQPVENPYNILGVTPPEMLINQWPTVVRGTMLMFYGMYKNWLMLEHSKNKYDLIIRTRFDSVLLGKSFDEDIVQKSLDGQLHWLADIYCIGRPQEIQFFFNMFQLLMPLWETMQKNGIVQPSETRRWLTEHILEYAIRNSDLNHRELGPNVLNWVHLIKEDHKHNIDKLVGTP